jgi:hypothetical protein
MTVALWRLRQEDHEFEASLGYIVRLCLKIKNKGSKLRDDSILFWYNFLNALKKEGRKRVAIVNH